MNSLHLAFMVITLIIMKRFNIHEGYTAIFSGAMIIFNNNSAFLHGQLHNRVASKALIQILNVIFHESVSLVLFCIIKTSCLSSMILKSQTNLSIECKVMTGVVHSLKRQGQQKYLPVHFLEGGRGSAFSICVILGLCVLKFAFYQCIPFRVFFLVHHLFLCNWGRLNNFLRNC